MNEPQRAAAPIVGQLLCQVDSPRSLLGISEIDVERPSTLASERQQLMRVKSVVAKATRPSADRK